MPKKVNLYFYKSMHKYLAFQRSSSDNIAASSLTLCEQTDGYEVTNIVSLEVPDLGISGYNDGLNGFIERIVNPNVMEVKLDATLIPRKRTITDWASIEVASTLHTFSVCANKSTGAKHASDRHRWFNFLFASCDTSSNLDAELLGRWLVEAEKRPPHTATELVDSYPYSTELLKSRATA